MFAFKLGKLSIPAQRPAIAMNPAAQRALVVTPHHHRIGARTRTSGSCANTSAPSGTTSTAPMILGTLGVIEVALNALDIPHGKGGTEAAIDYLGESVGA